MRIIGVDPGTYNMGVGVVDADGNTLRLVHANTLKATRGNALSERLRCLYASLLDFIDEYEPAAMAIEEPFVARNVRSAMAVGQAQAIAMLAAATLCLDVHSYAPREVKMAITGFGGSSKEQVHAMVTATLNLDAPPPSFDASDAVAVAICHINASRAQALIASERP